MKKSVEITTAAQVAADLRASNGSEKVTAMIDAGIARVASFGSILICARLSNLTHDHVRPRVIEVLQQYYPAFDDPENILIEDMKIWDQE